MRGTASLSLSTLTRAVALGTATFAFAGQAAAGPIINGGFEDSTLSGWTGSAYGAVVANDYPAAPLAGNYSALIISRGRQSAAGPGNPTFGCAADPWMLDPACPPAPYPGLSTIGPSGSGAIAPNPGFSTNYIQQSFDALAGEVVAIDWRGLTNDNSFGIEGVVIRLTNGAVYIDNHYGFLNGNTILSGSFGAIPTVLGNTQAPSGSAAPSGTGFSSMTQVITTSTVVPTAGEWTLFAAVSQRNDSSVSSGMLVDNLRIQRQAVPEPGSIALVGIAAAALLGARRRKHSA